MPNEVRLYNSLTRQVEPLRTIEPGVVRYYVCGISASGEPHVGHGRSYVVFDTVRRVLEHAGYQVRHVQNFTDIEESITTRAAKAGLDPMAYAERMMDAYFEQMDRLGVKRAHHFPRVTEFMDEIIAATGQLDEQDCAYHIDDGIAFRVCDVEGFGQLLGADPADAVVHNVPEEAWNGRENAFDFILWRDDDAMGRTWKTPWGEGRPGWHTECAVMATSLLGPTIDLHGGGHDLIFPHHESERAIARCLTGEDFCNHWVHNGLITMGGEKMSKSLGNYQTLSDGIDEHGAACVRVLYLEEPYRTSMEWRGRTLERAHTIVDALAEAVPNASEGTPSKEVAHLRREIVEALRNDLDTPRALELTLELAKGHGEDPGSRYALGEVMELFGLNGLEPFHAHFARAAEDGDGR